MIEAQKDYPFELLSATKHWKIDYETKALMIKRPFTEHVSDALSNFLKASKGRFMNLKMAFRLHEFNNILGGNPGSIKMLTDFMKRYGKTPTEVYQMFKENLELHRNG